MKYLGLLLFFLCFSPLISQSQKVATTGLEADLIKAHKVLEIYHPNAYYYRDSASIRELREALSQGLPDSISQSDAYRKINQFVVAFNDAHTRVYASDILAAYRDNGGTYFPLNVRIEDRQLIISTVYGEGIDSLLVGQKILAINGIPAETLLGELVLHASRETPELDHTLISANFPHYLWLAYGWEAPYQVQLADETLDLKGVPYSAIVAQSTTSEQPTVTFEVLESGVAYLRIRDFDSMGRKGFRRAYAKAFAHFRSAGATQNLILDLRGHDGGDVRYGEDLARYFADTSFRSFNYSLWKATPAFKKTFKQVYVPFFVRWALPVIKGLNPHTKAIYSADDHTNARVEYAMIKPRKGAKYYPGQVYLLMDHFTFSAGTSFAAMFKDFNMGTIIGQPSGNTANYYADAMLRSRLTNVGVILRISTSYNVRPSGEETPLQPVQPDHYLPLSTNSLAYALELIRQGSE